MRYTKIFILGKQPFKFLFAGFFLIAIITGCIAQEGAYQQMLKVLLSDSIPMIQPDELNDFNKSYVLLDVRSEEEFEVSHLKGAELLAFDSFSGTNKQLPAKDVPVVLYCSVGYRSEKVGEKLTELGYSEIYNLYGGIFQWKNEGNTVVDTEGQVTDRVHTYSESWSKWLKSGIPVYD